MELAIDTSTEIASVAFSSEGRPLAELTWRAGQNHTQGLLHNLHHLKQQAGISFQDIKGVVVARGPGSFNGLRVGMSTAKGLVLALGIPIVGIGTLEVEAYPHANAALPICPVYDAGRGEVAAALYQTKRGRWQQLMEEHITTIEALSAKIRSRTIFCGRLPLPYVSEIKRRLGRLAFFPGEAASLRRAGYLAELGWRRLKAGDYDNPATLQPLYLRRPPITISPSHRNRAKGKTGQAGPQCDAE